MTTGIMANVKRALTGEIKDLVDPYVAVSFAGHKVSINDDIRLTVSVCTDVEKEVKWS